MYPKSLFTGTKIAVCIDEETGGNIWHLYA